MTGNGILKMVSVVAALAAFGAEAAKVEKGTDVSAEGYPSWPGVNDEAHLAGRRLTPSDLRQRYVIIAEMDDTDLAKQMVGPFWTAEIASDVPRLREATFSGGWERCRFERDVLVVLSIFGSRPKKAIAEDLAKGVEGKGAVCDNPLWTPAYRNLKFAGSPDGTGKRPFMYLLDGTNVLYAESFVNNKTNPEIRKLATAGVEKKKADGKKWKPFFGYVSEPNFYPKYARQLRTAWEKSRGVDTILKDLKRGISAPDAEKREEALMLYDALNQELTSCLFMAEFGMSFCKPRSAYEYLKMKRLWPGEAKRFAGIAAEMKKTPDLGKLAKFMERTEQLRDTIDEQKKNRSTAKKLVAELKAVKKFLEPMKESKDTAIQGCAMLVDSECDDLISQLQ